MKPTDATLNAILASRQFLTADLITITLYNGSTLHYCSGAQDIVFNGSTYTAGGIPDSTSFGGPYWDRKDNKAKVLWRIGSGVDSLSIDVIPGAAQVGGMSFNNAIRSGIFDNADFLLQRAFMPATIGGSTSVILALLHFDGANGSTSFIDATGRHTFAAVTGSPVLATSTFEFGTASFFTNGAVAQITSDGNVASADFQMGSGTDFTVDFWVNMTNNAIQNNLLTLDGTSGSQVIYYTPSVGIKWFDGGDRITGATTIANNTFHHVALVRHSNVLTLYLDGVSQGTYNDSGKSYTGILGPGGNTGFQGHQDEVRVQQTAVWTTNFTPPTSAYSIAAGPSVSGYGTIQSTNCAVTMFQGLVGQIDVDRAVATFTVDDYRILFNQQMPKWLYAPACQNTLYDTNCSLSAAANASSGTISAGSSQTFIASTNNGISTNPNQWFDGGSVKFLTGANTGITMTVSSFAIIGSAGTIYFTSPLPFIPSTLDTYLAYPGCDRSTGAGGCSKNWASTGSNIVNFRGMPYIPDPGTAV